MGIDLGTTNHRLVAGGARRGRPSAYGDDDRRRGRWPQTRTSCPRWSTTARTAGWWSAEAHARSPGAEFPAFPHLGWSKRWQGRPVRALSCRAPARAPSRVPTPSGGRRSDGRGACAFSAAARSNRDVSRCWGEMLKVLRGRAPRTSWARAGGRDDGGAGLLRRRPAAGVRATRDAWPASRCCWLDRPAAAPATTSGRLRSRKDLRGLRSPRRHLRHLDPQAGRPACSRSRSMPAARIPPWAATTSIAPSPMAAGGRWGSAEQPPGGAGGAGAAAEESSCGAFWTRPALRKALTRTKEQAQAPGDRSLVNRGRTVLSADAEDGGTGAARCWRAWESGLRAEGCRRRGTAYLRRCRA